ncbi:MAG TPA: peptide chain release factor N(5)-glutamine methyltransferase [Devosiaceae bacterium]|jgi:release factor glutamine methyltransferase
MQIGAAWRAVRDRFRAAGLDTPDLDARLLAQQAFGLEGAALATHERDPADGTAMAALDGLAMRRLAGEPVARILGEKEFYGLRFGLNAATLVPRPETELLVDLGMPLLVGGERVLDLGTGSGCIAIALLYEAQQASGVAIDLSAEALGMATVNAARNGVGERLTLLEGSWFEPLPDSERFDLIVSNPPYIESAVIEGLQTDVRDFDPVLALDGGPDGLAPYRIIAAEAAKWLQPKGTVMVEIGATQGKTVSALFESAGFGAIAVKTDLAGLDRVVIAHHS